MTRKRSLRAIALPALCALSAVPCFAQPYVISTLAGGSPVPTPTLAASAAIGTPRSLFIDSANAVYFTSQNCIYKLTTDGLLTLVAGNSRAGFSGDGGFAQDAQLWAPDGLAVDAAGNVFVADAGNNRIREILATNGVIVTVAGSGAAGFSGDGGPAVSAQLSAPAGVAVDSQGNLFIADTGNNRVRKVSPAGIVTTLAGNGSAVFSGDGGPAASAQLSATSIALDALGNLYVGDTANYRVREIAADGSISTIAGSGFPGYSGDGSSAQSAQFSVFRQLTVDPVGNLYIADTGNSVIRKVTSGDRIVTTLAGNGQPGFFGDSFAATIAALSSPSGVALDSKGEVLIADTANYRIRIVTTDGRIDSVAGSGLLSYSGDGRAPLNAQLSGPRGIAADRLGNLYIADTGNNRVRVVPASGVVSTAAGNGVAAFSGDGGKATAASLSGPVGVTVDAGENLLIADAGNYRVRQVSLGTIGPYAGAGGSVLSGDGGPAEAAGMTVSGIALDSAGNLFMTDSFNHRVREVLANGTIATLAGTGQAGFSGDDGPALQARFSTLAGIAVDAAGYVYVVDAGNQRVRRISPSGAITTVAGNGIAGFSGDGGPALSAQLRDPSGIAVDSGGNLYIADTGNNRIRKVSPDGAITTIAGSGVAAYTGDGGVGTAATLNAPAGIAVGKAGVVYVADTGNNAIRLLTPSTSTVVIASVVDAASESASPLSPGKIAVIYGSGLGPQQLAINQPVNGVFGQQLAGTTVSFRGITAPIYYTSSTQVAAIVPYEISGATSAAVVVSYQGAVSSQFIASFADTSPGIFTANATGAGQAAAINVADGTLNSAANPAKIGDYISLYATGEGQTSPAGSDGKLANGALPAPLAAVTATVGGIAATVQYEGAAPGAVAGLLQVNVRIPAGGSADGTIPALTPGGHVPVVLTIGKASTVSGAVWIAVSN